MSITTRRRVLQAAAGAIALGLTATLSGCVGGAAQPASDASGTTTLHLVGFAVPKEANNAIQKKFAETPEGKGVVWEESYGASGDQSRAVVAGLKADYVHFSLETDVTRLVEGRAGRPSWKDGPTKGIVTDSVVVIVVRRATPRTSRAGTTWSSRASRSSRRTRPRPARRAGTSWRPTARSIADGGTEADAEGVPDQVLRQRRRAAGQRPRRHHRLPRGHRRRAALLRERGDPGPAERRGLRLHRSRRRPC